MANINIEKQQNAFLWSNHGMKPLNEEEALEIIGGTDSKPNPGLGEFFEGFRTYPLTILVTAGITATLAFLVMRGIYKRDNCAPSKDQSFIINNLHSQINGYNSQTRRLKGEITQLNNKLKENNVEIERLKSQLAAVHLKTG